MTQDEIDETIKVLVLASPREFAGLLWGLPSRKDVTIPFIEALLEARFAAIQAALKKRPHMISTDSKQVALTQYKAVFGDATLMDACLDLRMACNGSGDPIPNEEKDKQMSALEGRLKAWTPSHGPQWAEFDEAVRQVVIATLVEVGSSQ